MTELHAGASERAGQRPGPEVLQAKLRSSEEADVLILVIQLFLQPSA